MTVVVSERVDVFLTSITSMLFHEVKDDSVRETESVRGYTRHSISVNRFPIYRNVV